MSKNSQIQTWVALPSHSTQSGPPESPWQASTPPMIPSILWEGKHYQKVNCTNFVPNLYEGGDKALSYLLSITSLSPSPSCFSSLTITASPLLSTRIMTILPSAVFRFTTCPHHHHHHNHMDHVLLPINFLVSEACLMADKDISNPQLPNGQISTSVIHLYHFNI